MEKGSTFWITIALLGLAALECCLANQEPEIPEHEVTANIGESTNLMCTSRGLPISNCLWEKGGGSPVVFSNSNLDQTVSGGKYKYVGKGFESGECGLTILEIDEGDNGIWKCSLFAGSQFFRGEVNLSLLMKPQPPKFDPPFLAPSSEYSGANITCYSSSGQPSPIFAWYLDDKPLRKNLGPINTTTTTGVLYTFQQLIGYKFTANDYGKDLKCVIIHESLTENDINYVKVPVDIKFPPKEVSGGSRNINLRAEPGFEFYIKVNVSANPMPDTVYWTVNGTKYDVSSSAKPGRFQVKELKHMGYGVYEATLGIRHINEDDIKKSYTLSVRNTEGSADFRVKLYSGFVGSAGLGAGGIIGIILAIAALLIILAVLVVYTRARGLLCFKGDDGTSSEKERMGGSTQADDEGNEKPGAAQRLSSRLSALYETLVSKKKDKSSVPTDEEAANANLKEKEKQEYKDGSAPMEKADEKKPDDIVYAELDLARANANAEVKVRCVDEKTEYVEIVGVAPPPPPAEDSGET